MRLKYGQARKLDKIPLMGLGRGKIELLIGKLPIIKVGCFNIYNDL